MRALLVKDPRQFFIECGFELSKDDMASLNDNGTLLTVRATDAELGRISAVLDGRPPDGYYEAGRNSAASERTRRKADGIVLAASEFAHVPLNIALKKLQAESVLHDSASPKAERGVKIRFERRKPYQEEVQEERPIPQPPKVPGLDPVADARYDRSLPAKWIKVRKTDPIPTVTGSAKNISLLEAVSTLARMAGYRAYIQADEIVVRDPFLWDDVLVKEYRAPRAFPWEAPRPRARMANES